MEERKPTASPDQTAPTTSSPNFGAKLLRVAWLAVLLGLAMEVLLLLLSTGLGEAMGLGAFAADLVKNVSWSAFVCVGLAIGTTVAKVRLPLAGLAGLISAPLAFEVSRALHKGTLQALAIPAGASDGSSEVVIALVKGLEYGCLGLAVGWLATRPWGGAAAHALSGLLVGLVFGGAVLILSLPPTPQLDTADLVSRAANEILFPVGCAMVLFSASTLGKRMAR